MFCINLKARTSKNNIMMSSLQKEGHRDDFSSSLAGTGQVVTIQREVEADGDPRLSLEQEVDLTNRFLIFQIICLLFN